MEALITDLPNKHAFKYWQRHLVAAQNSINTRHGGLTQCKERAGHVGYT